ncbi:hypothetical protein HUW62_05745 [Myxococcus sp. AM011]|uniref:hypothetical protein n=1 Tax=Myxococcus sp. AM011 TaxID=2745200 RepID=UPI001595502F|nr:hypothetical protein [Myxococcus sp. AM011]NVJ20716.1 hypothetical protein [Myxococcus sp. AM011]
MALRTTHNLQRGIHRLLMAPQDVPVKDPVPWREPMLTLAAASAGHRALFTEYEEFLADSMLIAFDLWEDRIHAHEERGLDPDSALKAAYNTFFAGPASCPQLVWVVRTYWLKCDALNRTVPPDERVPPQVLLFGWVLQAGRDDWVQVLTAMTYWPMGIDADGHWV